MASFLTNRRLPNYPIKYSFAQRTLRKHIEVVFCKDERSFIAGIEDHLNKYNDPDTVMCWGELNLQYPDLRGRAWFYGSVKAGAFSTCSAVSQEFYQPKYETLISRNSQVLPFYQHDRRLGTKFSKELDYQLQDSLLKWQGRHLFNKHDSDIDD